MFHDIAHLTRLRIDAALKPYGLTRLKWLAIGIIADNEGFSQADLASRLELRGAATGKLVDRLVERGLVERRMDISDRRAYRLFATQKSNALLLELEPMGEDLRQDILQGLDDEDIGALKSCLIKIKANLLGVAVGIVPTVAFKSEFILPMV
jgi:DNA-binding MarR family transcriptional regulator